VTALAASCGAWQSLPPIGGSGKRAPTRVVLGETDRVEASGAGALDQRLDAEGAAGGLGRAMAVQVDQQGRSRQQTPPRPS
jgi:hypothetical protein